MLSGRDGAVCTPCIPWAPFAPQKGRAKAAAHRLGGSGTSCCFSSVSAAPGTEGLEGGHAAGVRQGDAPGTAQWGNPTPSWGEVPPWLRAALEHSCHIGEKRQLGAHTALSPWPFWLHRTPKEDKRVCVTHLTSITQLQKELSCCHAMSVSLAWALPPISGPADEEQQRHCCSPSSSPFSLLDIQCPEAGEADGELG